MKKLDLAGGLEIPLNVVTEKLAWIGVTGSGKSYGASKLAEMLWAEGAQFIVLDPVGIWYGLRLDKDGKRPGVPVPVFGGLHGDVPLEATGGALVADLLADRNLSAVLDVSQFESDADKARFVSAFTERFFQRKKAAPSAVHIFFEECQEFVPQNPQPGEQMMLHRVHRLQKLGRNFGIGTSLITQRPQETSKKALNQAQTVFAFRLTGSQERKAVELWIADKGLDQDLVASLPKIETGHCHVWSPAWLKVSKMVHIAAKHTFDASATPTVGELRAARALAPIDLEQLREAMKATVEKAKAEDPKELQAQLAALRKKLYGLETKHLVAAPATRVERVEVPALQDAQVKRLEVAFCRAEKMSVRTLEAVAEMGKLLAANVVRTAAAVQRLPHPTPSAVAPIVRPFDPARDKHIKPWRDADIAVVKDASGLSGPQQKILAALVFLEGIGFGTPDKFQLALFVGVQPTSGSYANNLGALRTAGLVAYPGPGTVALTNTGHAAAPNVKMPNTTAELQATVLARVSGPQRALLERIIKAHPETLLKTELADDVGVSPSSGSYANNLGRLRTMGVVTYPKPGDVRAADILFLGL